MNKAQRRQRKADRKRRRQENGKAAEIAAIQKLKRNADGFPESFRIPEVVQYAEDDDECDDDEDSEYQCPQCGLDLEVDAPGLPFPICMICGGREFD